MDKKQLNSLKRWRVCGVFCNPKMRGDIFADISKNIIETVNILSVVYIYSESCKQKMNADNVFFLEDMSTKRSNKFLQASYCINKNTLLVVDDIETIRNYPQSMTRNIINYIAPKTRYKIIGGNDLIVSNLYDLYAEFAVLDKRILYANHYWCYKSNHREVSVFDGTTVVNNKDVLYTARKLKPFIYFDLQPNNDIQNQLYNAIREAESPERSQNLLELEL